MQIEKNQNMGEKKRIKNYEKVSDLWNKGLREEEIKEALGITRNTVNVNLREARLRGITLIGYDSSRAKKIYDPNLKRNVPRGRKKTKDEIKKEEDARIRKLLEEYKITSWKDTEGYINENIERILKSNIQLHLKIKELSKFIFPLEIAKLLNIKPKEVFDILNGLTETEKDEIKRQFITNRLNISENIKSLVGMGLNYGKALLELDRNIPQELTIELAEVYFCIGEENKALRILQFLYLTHSTPKEIKEKAMKRREELKMEFKARKIEKHTKTGNENISYDELCKKYRVTENFVVELLGSEEKDY